jgi:hypothetical protein
MSRGISSINPATGEIVRKFEPHSDSEVEQRIEFCAQAFRGYRKLPIAERARFMVRLAELPESEKREHARTITLEMGKPIRAAIQEVEKCAAGCRFYAENAARFLADVVLRLTIPPWESGRIYSNAGHSALNFSGPSTGGGHVRFHGRWFNFMWILLTRRGNSAESRVLVPGWRFGNGESFLVRGDLHSRTAR